jgi:hypothetical protein
MSDATSGHAQPPLAPTPPYRSREVTGWVGWVIFAGIMMIMIGLFEAIAGFVALFRPEYYVVGSDGLLVHLNWDAWGWIHIILAVLVVFAGFAVLQGQLWGRLIGIGLAVVGALVNLSFLAAYPLWNTILIALNVIVIYALAVHGREAADV